MSLDHWGSAFSGVGLRTTLETDEQLRDRLMYVAGDGDAMVRRIRVASGVELDTIAESVGLRRREMLP